MRRLFTRMDVAGDGLGDGTHPRPVEAPPEQGAVRGGFFEIFDDGQRLGEDGAVRLQGGYGAQGILAR